MLNKTSIKIAKKIPDKLPITLAYHMNINLVLQCLSSQMLDTTKLALKNTGDSACKHSLAIEPIKHIMILNHNLILNVGHCIT